ncbi:YlbG family protein [Vagococcus vulneris]|nr:YlbG family protein [Vagococcus vulneris]
MVNNKITNDFQINPRRGLIIWVYSFKQLKQLKRFGYVHYVSRKMKYVLIYVDETDVHSIQNKLEKLFFVRRVDKSLRPDINMDFNNRLGNKDFSNVEEPLEFEEQKTKIRLADYTD